MSSLDLSTINRFEFEKFLKSKINFLKFLTLIIIFIDDILFNRTKTRHLSVNKLELSVLFTIFKCLN